MKQTRRDFLTTSALAAIGARAGEAGASGAAAEPIIDIHQHLGYSGRADEALLRHQTTMGITTTVLLPAGRPVNTASTHEGVSNGLQAEALGNEPCRAFARAHKDAYRFGANEVPDIAGAAKEIERYLAMGGVIIAEQKFGVECDSPEMQAIYALAQDHRVPVLMHWQYKMYNYGFDRFHKMLEKYPRVNFLGHAQTWWANVDKNYVDDAKNLYPKGPIAAGGLTDRYLRDYPNMYGDLSAGSGLNALTRDEGFTREFIVRHQNKLVFGSDCSDSEGAGEKCIGSQTIATVRRLASPEIQRKLFSGNAKKVFRAVQREP
jgi:predicted TIM-barrel fold metal-dependent hydrolase